MSVERVDARKRRSRPGGVTSLACSTLLVAFATALGIAGTGGAHALLQGSASMPGATITAGTLELQINGQASAALGSWELSPAAGQARAFTVRNVGDMEASLSASAAVTSQQAIGARTQARLTPVSAASQCRTGLNGTQGVLDGYTVASLDTIAAGQTKTYCLELSLAAGTPANLAGQGVLFSLTMNSAQKER